MKKIVTRVEFLAKVEEVKKEKIYAALPYAAKNQAAIRLFGQPDYKFWGGDQESGFKFRRVLPPTPENWERINKKKLPYRGNLYDYKQEDNILYERQIAGNISQLSGPECGKWCRVTSPLLGQIGWVVVD